MRFEVAGGGFVSGEPQVPHERRPRSPLNGARSPAEYRPSATDPHCGQCFIVQFELVWQFPSVSSRNCTAGDGTFLFVSVLDTCRAVVAILGGVRQNRHELFVFRPPIPSNLRKVRTVGSFRLLRRLGRKHACCDRKSALCLFAWSASRLSRRPERGQTRHDSFVDLVTILCEEARTMDGRGGNLIRFVLRVSCKYCTTVSVLVVARSTRRCSGRCLRF